MLLKRRLKHLSLWALCGSLWSCNLNEIPNTDNLYLPKYKPSIALILGKDTVNVREFLDELGEDANIIEGENMNLSFIYKDSSDFELGSDFVKISSFSNAKYISSPISVPYTPPVDTTLTIARSVAFNFPATEGEKLDSTYYTAGNFELLLNTNFPGDVSYAVETSSFQEIATANPITINSTAEYTGTVPFLDENIVALNGYKTILSAEADSNKFVLDIEASITIPANTPLSGNEYLYFTLNIADPEFEAVFGDFGEDTFNIKTQRISLDVFSDFGDSGIKFESPTITFDFENSFGIPVGLDFSQVYGRYDDKDALYLSGAVAESPQYVAATHVENYGSITNSSIVLGPDNSNLADLLSSTPDELVFSLTGYSNPTEDDSVNYLMNGSSIQIKSTVHMPLSVQMDKFEYESEFELGDMSQIEGSEEITLVFNTENELPFRGEIDLFFMDEAGNEFDSLKNNVLFESPDSFDSDGKVTAPRINTSEISLNAERIESLINATDLRLVTRLFSHGYDKDEYVEIFSDYSMIITLSVNGTVSVDLNSED